MIQKAKTFLKKWIIISWCCYILAHKNPRALRVFRKWIITQWEIFTGKESIWACNSETILDLSVIGLLGVRKVLLFRINLQTTQSTLLFDISMCSQLLMNPEMHLFTVSELVLRQHGLYYTTGQLYPLF
ncbi:nucleolar and spindle-associated protein 1 [Platysternon megacephalum]|uniref:Nucleolar and spindle-associated protein 1 n=1 Tax=Platysternon megacephalum TaxID=55544 RepID=A0A4D9EXM7_9SAUR|nr:nucleolar and spindle-associated protein 1 [Platysternon megacephalum]